LEKENADLLGTVFEIKRFAVHDGYGIRTTVFLKGCPLKCVWCHNPEGIGFEPQLAYYEKKCISCGVCVEVCPAGAHSFREGKHEYRREECVACGKCEDVCPGGALKHYGKRMTVAQLLPILLEDKDFYDTSGGGVTLSGGECLTQPTFCAQLLRELKQRGIHTAIDTCGFVSQEAIDRVLPYTDLFLYDIKAFDEDVHIRCTGHSNKVILNHLKYIDASGGKIEIRIPYVPGYNDDQIEKIAAFLQELRNVTAVRILPYHNYAGSKYEALDVKNTLPERPEDLETETAKRILVAHGLKYL